MSKYLRKVTHETASHHYSIPVIIDHDMYS